MLCIRIIIDFLGGTGYFIAMNAAFKGLGRPFPYCYRHVSLLLIGINVGVYFFSLLFPNLPLFLSLNPVLFVRDRFYWTLLTYMFVHGGMNHILFNMLGLFFFGPQVEQRMGSWEFLSFYLGTGLLAGGFSLVVYLFSGSYNVFLMGASGALFAVLLAFAVYFPFAKIYLFGILPLQSTMMVLLYGGIELLSLGFGRGNVAHLTHLAGLFFGYFYFRVRLRMNPVRVFRDSRKQKFWRG